MNDHRLTETKNKPRRSAWKAAAAVAALCITLPTGAYAANRYLGISDFFARSGHELTDDADKLIEKNIEQTPEKSEAQEMPVTFQVKEALCDSGTVSIVIEASAAESGRYLLVPIDCTKEDSVAFLGMEGTQTIGEYAASKHLEILHVNAGFRQDSPFFPASCGIDTKTIHDDTISLCINADRSGEDTELDAIAELTVRPDGASDDEVMRASTSFTLEDQSSSRIVRYSSESTMEVPDTTAVITKVEMEQTEVHTYVKVYYTHPNEKEDDGLYFRIRDSRDSSEWPSSGGKGVEQLEDGSYYTTLIYETHDLPEHCVIEAFDCWEKTVHGQFELTKDN